MKIHHNSYAMSKSIHGWEVFYFRNSRKAASSSQSLQEITLSFYPLLKNLKVGNDSTCTAAISLTVPSHLAKMIFGLTYSFFANIS